ncbi:MAG: elongation factor Ts, partial [Alphaproteobacteria bacterium]|nr:elongation factor Ts [Alphaproteobacteria bacterium]
VDGESRVKQVVEKAAKDFGAPVKLAGFARFQLGEGIEKAPDCDFAAEVAKMAG